MNEFIEAVMKNPIAYQIWATHNRLKTPDTDAYRLIIVELVKQNEELKDRLADEINSRPAAYWKRR